MKTVVILFLSFALLSCTSVRKEEPQFLEHPLAIVQGTTDFSQTYISILSYHDERPLKFFVSEKGSGNKPFEVGSFLKKLSPDKSRVVERIHIKNLEAKKDYVLSVKKNGKIIDERFFKSLNLKKQNIRVGVASCMDDRIESATEMWSSYLNKFLDVNFFIGDNVYADRLDDGSKKVADEAQLWLRYTQTWDRLYFYHSSVLSPTYYLWDDHDYGKNDGGAEYVHREKAAEVFWTFHPNEEIKDVYRKTLGAGSILTAFGQKFIFVDGRYFRQNNKGVHWGDEQKEIVFKELKGSKANMNWLIQGDQFFGAYHPFESFEKDNAKEFKRTLKAIKKTKKKVIFVSGDRHLTEVMKIEKAALGFETYEITSSGIHAKVFPGSFERSPNPRGEVGKSGVYNYSVIEFDREKAKEGKYKVTSYGAKEWTHYTKELSL